MIFFLFSLVDWILGEVIYHYNYIDDDNFVAIQRIRKFNESDNKNKIAIFGSSMSREGINEPYLSASFPGSEIYNFSVSSGVPDESFLMASQLKNIENAKLAIICILPWMFQKRYSGSIVDRSDVTTNIFFSPLAFLKIVPIGNINLNWFLGKTFYSFFNILKYNDFLKQIADHNDLSFWKPKNERLMPVVWPEYRYIESYKEDYFTQSINDPAIKSRFDSDYYWRVGDSVQMRALEAIIKLFEEKGVKVLVIDMPINLHIKELYGKDTETDFAAAIAAVVPASDFFEANFLYDKSKFIDFDHLNYKGRELFTSELIKKITTLHVF